jgi:hypothetical protein
MVSAGDLTMGKKLDYWPGDERAPFDRFNDERYRQQMLRDLRLKIAVVAISMLICAAVVLVFVA